MSENSLGISMMFSHVQPSVELTHQDSVLILH